MHCNAASLQRLDDVPPFIEEAVKAIKPSLWLKRACSKYRRCSSLHMGLGIPRNLQRARGLKFCFGRLSHLLPELQQQLLDYVRGIAPHIQFSSIILNRFEVGDSMGCHEDGNIFPMQLTIRFGDAVGAQLCTQGGSVGNGVFLMNSNAPHSVSRCEAGVRYSIVTYIKNDAVVLADWRTIRTLSQWGFPVQCLALLHALLLLCCLQNIPHKIGRDSIKVVAPMSAALDA